MSSPVLFLLFNRPDLALRVFERIREARPPKLFIAVDGPRLDQDGEMEACGECREITNKVDWECEVYTLFRDKNLGCRRAVGEAITWFFDHVEEGIILEDDCLPDPSFFPFCLELLERYRDDERVMCISGDNFQNGQLRGKASYYFSIFNHCWGWATWRTSWQHFDTEMLLWPEIKERQLLEGFLTNNAAIHWSKIFDQLYKQQIDSWAYIWGLSCWSQHGLAILPNVNLVSNIGFGKGSTHTEDSSSWISAMPTKEMFFPMDHPTLVMRDILADRFTEANMVGIRQPLTFISFFQRAIRKLKTFFN